MAEDAGWRQDRAATGIQGLDELLMGGLPRRKLYLVEGTPGVGKTTLAMQFAMRGAADGERVLYVLMSENEAESIEIANSHGWSLEGVEMMFQSHSAYLKQEAQQTMLHPAEVELPEATRPIVERIDEFNPQRLVLDSLSEFRLLANDERFFRRQLLALKEYLAERGCTTLMLDARARTSSDVHVHSIASGIIELEQLSPKFGANRRRLQVRKVRGMQYLGGYHDYVIRKGGIEVYPRLVAAEHRNDYAEGVLRSGNPQLDNLIGGGLDKGTSTVLLGPAGVGKSNISLQYAVAAARRGEKSAIYAFDERTQTILRRAKGIGLGLEQFLESGLIKLLQVDPAEMTSGEFSQAVREDCRAGRKLIVIDSLTGYFQSMPEEHFLLLHLHELLSYLNQQGAVTMMIVAQHGIVGSNMQPPLDVSYIADNVFALRYFEHAGTIRKAICVFKRRSGTHQRTVHEMQITPDGIWIGEPLADFHGVLTGVPTVTGDRLMKDSAE